MPFGTVAFSPSFQKGEPQLAQCGLGVVLSSLTQGTGIPGCFCQPADSQGLPSRVRFFSITIPPLAKIWILGKMRKKGKEGKRERLSSKRNRLTKPGLGGFAERPVSCQMGQAWGWGPGWTRCLH